ncbi:MAG: hypothetical protein JST51_01465 [Armatimonadetes bacterium]|nr:hypothetical protein [Armatimonadota bacterium]
MGFDDWMVLVQNAGGKTADVRLDWLHHQFTNGASPAIVAQSIKDGTAPANQPIPVVDQPKIHCKGCGSIDLFWEPIPVLKPGKKGGGRLVSGAALTVLGGGLVGIPLMISGAAKRAGSQETEIKQVLRCRRCGRLVEP